MKTFKVISITLLTVSLLFSCAQSRGMVTKEEKKLIVNAENLIESMEAPVGERERPFVMVHYMPWYEAPPVSDGYGWHWHMGSFEPYKKDVDGLPQIASQYMPLTGPYDSSDPAVLEYQSLLMVMAGIDGVIADWYGIKEALDYGTIHKASRKLFSAMGKAGLRFAVCYEDQTMIKMVEGGALPYKETVPHGKEVMDWMDSHWFLSDTYLKMNGQPAVLDFGPQFFTLRSQWDTMFEGLDNPPLLIALDGHMERDADGLFPWPPMHMSEGGVLSLQQTASYLVRFYKENKDSENLVATAFPGFHDIYREAGIGNSYGYLDSLKGETFGLTLKAADKSGASVIQVATWNDYGEGTGIEPTVETGYGYLEELQEYRRSYEEDFLFDAKDLRIPIQILNLRRRKADDRDLMKQLDELYEAIVRKDGKAYKSLIGETGLKPSEGSDHIIDTSADIGQVGTVMPEEMKGVNQALGMSTRDNGHVYAFISNNAVDGDPESYWEGAQDSYPNEFIIDLKEIKSVKAVRIRLNPKRLWAARTMKIALETGIGNGEYAEAVPFADYRFDPVANGNTVTIELSGDFRFIKLIGMSNSEAKAMQIAELEVY